LEINPHNSSPVMGTELSATFVRLLKKPTPAAEWKAQSESANDCIELPLSVDKSEDGKL